MYTKLQIELDSTLINFQKSSNLQGIIMENIDSDYAEKLHGNQLNPYSQFVIKEDGKTFWNICTLTDEAYENIILPMNKLDVIKFKKNEMEIPVLSRKLYQKEEQDLTQEFYRTKCSNHLQVKFCTPTAFKRDGKYVNYPDLRLLYGSLMRKYSAASSLMEMEDEDTLDLLAEQSEITKYRLQTIPFPLERIKINGFVGTIGITFHGTETMARYARMLFEFGEFSGAGIKTGIGMGAIQCYRRERND